MADNFENFGIRFVTEGAKSAITDIMGFNKAVTEGDRGLNNFSKSSEKNAKSGGSLADKLKNLGKSAKISKDDITDLTTSLFDLSGIGGNLPNIFNLASNALTKFSGFAGVAVAGLTAFILLGTRSAGLRGIIEGFDELAQQTGQDTDIFLSNLRRASAGTVSETALMTQANTALAGTSGIVAEEIGKKLPQVLEIARAQARRTGQSTDFLFQSLVTGIKRSSPLLIDNTGLVLSVGDANKAMAESLGVSVEQLTEEQKTIALLNATLEAGASSVAAMQAANETAAEKIARANSTITNMLDDLGLAVQPAFEVVLDVVNFFLSAIEAIVQPLARVVQFVLRGFQLMFDGIVFVLNGIIQFVSGFVLNLIQPLLPFEATWTNIWTNATNAVTDAFKLMAFGVGSIMGAFANGLWQAAVSITRIVAIIAQSIADFLVGQSPPPEGPLSEIDTGGRNTMLAWLEGFGGVSLDPVADVAREVVTLMGDTMNMGLPAVEARLGQLDKAILPFQNRLKIVESQLEAIQEPANAAIRAIERQQNALADAFNSGDEAAAGLIRQLDAQRALIEGNLSAEEARVDNAKIQLGLMKSAQAEERARLEIRKAMLSGDAKQVAKAIAAEKKLNEAKGAGPAGGAGGAAQTPVQAMGGMTPVQGQTGVDSLFSDMGDAFTMGFGSQFDMGNVGALEEAQGAIGSAWSEIASADPLAMIVDKFSGLGEELETSFITPIRDKVRIAVGFFTDPNQADSIPQRLQSFDFTSMLSSAFGTIGTALETYLVTPISDNVRLAVGYFTNPNQADSLAATLADFSIADLGIDLFSGLSTWLDEQLVQPFRDKIGGEEGVLGWFTNPALPGSLANMFLLLTTEGIAAALGIEGLGEMFGLFIQENIVDPMVSKITTLFALEGEGSIIAPFVTMGTTITESVGDLLPTITGIFAPIGMWVRGETDDGGLPGIKDAIIGVFQLIPTGIWGALQNIGGLLWDTLARPFIEAVNFIIRAMNDFFATITGGAFYGWVRDTLGIDLPETIEFGEISTARPAVLTATPPPTLARGGIMGAGMATVGEQGREVMASAKPFAVFSNRFIQAMDIFATTVDTLSSIVMQSAGTVIDNRTIDNSVNVTSKGNERNAAQTAAFLAGMRAR